MNNCIILTHAYIKSNEEHKIAPIEFAVRHYRHNNPNDYIMLLGHGLRPNVDCDYVYWEDPVNEKDINVGHPRLCNIAFEHAAQKGFKKILKTRSDSIHLILLMNAAHHFLQILLLKNVRGDHLKAAG